MWSVADFGRITNPNELRELNQAIGKIADGANSLMGEALDQKIDLEEIELQKMAAEEEFGPQVTMSGGGWMAIPVPNVPSLLAHIPIGKSMKVATAAAQQLALGRWALKRIQIPFLNIEAAFRQNGMDAEAAQIGITNTIIDNMYTVTRERMGDFPPFLERYNKIKEEFNWKVDFMQGGHAAHRPTPVDRDGNPSDGEGNEKYWDLFTQTLDEFGLEGSNTPEETKQILQSAGVGSLGEPLTLLAFLTLLVKLIALLLVIKMVTDTANSFITYYAAAAEAVRGLQKRKQARDDQFHEDVDREDELLDEKWRAIDSRDDLTASEKITFKENAQAERDQRVAGLTLNLEEENEKDQRNTEEDIETLNKTSFLGDLKGLVIPAAALLVGGLVITKL